MLRTIVAGTAVAGALTFGAVGIAGAATPCDAVHHAHDGNALGRTGPGRAGAVRQAAGRSGAGAEGGEQAQRAAAQGAGA